jgi:hypothetical protein
MFVYLISLLQVAAVAPNVQVLPQQDQPVLWREFRAGMNPTQFAAELRKVEGVKSVEITPRKKKPPKVKIAYSSAEGLEIGELHVAVTPVFIKDLLESISLSETGCFSAIEAKISKLFPALTERYPQQQRVKVVNSDEVAIDTQRAFHNQETRVTVSISAIGNPYPQHLYGGTGFMAAANKLANSLADSAYNSAIEACPLDKGRRAVLTLEYVSQERFAQEALETNAGRLAKAKATSEGL